MYTHVQSQSPRCNQGSNSSDISAMVTDMIAETDELLLGISVPQTRRLHQEQEKFCKDMTQQFEYFGVKFEDLSSAAQANINYIANVSSALGVSEPTMPKILTALSEIQRKGFQHEYSSLLLEDKESRLSELYQSQLTVQFQLKRLQEEIRSKDMDLENEAAQSDEKHDFFTKKCSQYIDSIQSCLASLQSCNFNESLSHSELAARRKKLDVQQAKIDSLKTEIDAFQNLPPNIDAAKQEMEKCKDQLRHLDEQITAQASESMAFHL